MVRVQEPRNRRSIRLKGYDYSRPGAYFVTIVTQNRECLFGEVVDGEMRLNELGIIVRDAWLNLPNHYAHVELEAFVVMPNHVHGIIVLTDIIGAGSNPATVGAGSKTATVGPDLNPATVGADSKTATMSPRHGLPEIVRAFKTFSARRINEHRGTPGVPVWQRNYWEHIIRNESALIRIRQYIAENPLRWQLDRENPDYIER